MKTIPKAIPEARTAGRQAGVTLVELMISMLLGMMLVVGMIQIFASNRSTYEFTQGLSRIQENARFALDHLAFNARMAGYRGCLSDVAFYNNLASQSAFRDDLGDGLRGHNFNGTGAGQTYPATATDPAPSGNPADWSPALPLELTAVAAPIPGSDVLVVRSVAGGSQALVTPFSSPTSLFVLPGHDFVPGEILVATDCQKASIFQLTGTAAVVPGISLEHGDDAAFSPANAAAAWGPEQDFGLGAEVARLQTHAFYVSRGANGRPTLFQLRLQPTGAQASGFTPAEELVEGVDTLQIRYGIDPDNDGAVNSWVTADGVADWTRVLSLEVSLLARSPEEYGTDRDTAQYNVAGTQFDPVDDRRLRQVFSTTIGVRNRLP